MHLSVNFETVLLFLITFDNISHQLTQLIPNKMIIVNYTYNTVKKCSKQHTYLVEQNTYIIIKNLRFSFV